MIVSLFNNKNIIKMINYCPEQACFRLTNLSDEKLALASIYRGYLANLLQLALEDLYYDNQNVRPKTLYEIGLVYCYGHHRAPRPKTALYREALNRLYLSADFFQLPPAKVAAVEKVFTGVSGVTSSMFSVIFSKIAELPDYKKFPLTELRKTYRGIHGQIINQMIDFFYPEDKLIVEKSA